MLKRNEKAAALLETAYLFLLAVISLMAFNYTTMSGVDFPDWLRHLVLLAAGLVAAARIVFDRGRSWLCLLGGVLCAGILYLARRSMQGYLLELAVLILGAQGIRFERIVKVYCAAILAALLLTMGLALGGVIENLIYLRDGHKRISFGIAYPTDFCAHVFFLSCCWLWLRERRIRWIEILALLALAWFCHYFCDARTSMLCFLLLAVGLAYLKLRRVLAAKKGTAYRMNRVVSLILCGSMPLVAALIIGLSLAYTDGNEHMHALNEWFSFRLELGRRGFDNYPLTLFGQFVEMNGNGNSLIYPDNYFWLDSSYINILLRLGIVAFLLVLVIFVVGAVRQRKNGSWERLGILAVIALQCMMEHHLIEIAHHPFLLMALAVSSVGPTTAEPCKGSGGTPA